ncbi:hypothetical protein Clacol_006339 [Clathrus columnatus]|uniref:Uncharacterized protein n=1 Tax=Clathrus columnatus TaxID=1419009 RepID=A0AAV5AG39_9AGAM|nr:hypothetical protein Clacol_006339 [Clathrus columnatus]
MALPVLLPKMTKGRAIELGSGIGYTALVLASMGWDVVATDTESIIRSVLRKNIDNNKASLSGTVQVRQLDWTTHEESSWDDLVGFDLILTADTLYAPHLVEPLLRTLHKLSYKTSTPVIVAIERRDGALLDNALERARTEFNFKVHRVPHKKLAKLVQKASYGWSKEDWSDIELWKLVGSSIPKDPDEI